MTPERDEISGRMTTGHEWNGIKELNTPIPRAFRAWLWSSIAVAGAMWVLYPAWPYVSDYSRGLIGYSSRAAVTEQVAEGAAERAEAFAIFETRDIGDLAGDPALKARFAPAISVLYRDNCAACHGSDLKGQPGFPNLTDGDWHWSGAPEEIEQTIRVGINGTHEETRYAQMPAFGRDGMLEKPDIADVAEYVLSLSGKDRDAEAAERGGTVFADNCASCHNDGGIGGLESGAPSLADDSWFYGGDRATILQTLQNGRAGVMPSWSGRLSDADIRKLALYVIWAGQDNGK